MKNLFLVCILLCTVSCQKKENGYLGLFSKEIEKELISVSEIIKDSLNKPESILATENHLVFLETNSDSYLTIYDRNTQTFSKKLPKGLGPGEAIRVQTIGVIPHTEDIYATDLSAQSLFIVSLNDTISTKIRKFSPTLDRRFCDAAYGDSIVFFLSVGGEQRFNAIHKGNILSFGNITDIPGFKPEVVSQTLQGPCTASSEQKKIAWFSVYGDVMEIYDYSNPGNIIPVKTYTPTLPVFADGYSGALSLNTKLSVPSVTSGPHNIFALYNEKTLLEAANNRSDAFFSKKILVFDWNGEPITIINVKHPICSISYDCKENRIFCLGLNEEGEYTVFSFSI